MKTKRLLSCFVWLSVSLLESIQPLHAQLDTLGFPLDIGNKWFYRYQSRSTLVPYVLVKAIIDTTEEGARLVRISRLYQDSVALGKEFWIVRNGNFYLDSILKLPLYNSSLSHDTTWWSYGDRYTYRLSRITLFGINRRCQIFSDFYLEPTAIESYKEYRVAPGVGPYYQYSWGYVQSYAWRDSSKLIGILINGKLYGDSLLASVNETRIITPETFELRQNYPNPFNSSTDIKFQIASAGYVTLKVYNLLGQEVATLVNARLRAGEHSVKFNAAGFANDVYLYRLETGSARITRKMLLMAN